MIGHSRRFFADHPIKFRLCPCMVKSKCHTKAFAKFLIFWEYLRNLRKNCEGLAHLRKNLVFCEDPYRNSPPLDTLSDGLLYVFPGFRVLFIFHPELLSRVRQKFRIFCRTRDKISDIVVLVIICWNGKFIKNSWSGNGHPEKKLYAWQVPDKPENQPLPGSSATTSMNV